MSVLKDAKSDELPLAGYRPYRWFESALLYFIFLLDIDKYFNWRRERDSNPRMF